PERAGHCHGARGRPGPYRTRFRPGAAPWGRRDCPGYQRWQGAGSARARPPGRGMSRPSARWDGTAAVEGDGPSGPHVAAGRRRRWLAPGLAPGATIAAPLCAEPAGEASGIACKPKRYRTLAVLAWGLLRYEVTLSKSL